MTPDDLIQAHFEGTLSKEGARELQAWLESDPSHLDDFIEQIEVHASLAEENAFARAVEGAKRPETSGPSPAAPAPGRRRSKLRRAAFFPASGSLPRGFVPTLVAACAVLAAATLFVAAGRRSHGPTPEKVAAKPEVPSPPPPQPAVTEEGNAPTPPVPPRRPVPAPGAEPEKTPDRPKPAPNKAEAPTPAVPPRPQEDPPPAKPKPAPDPLPQETVVAAAKVERVEGDVVRVSARGRLPLKGGEDVLAGDGLVTSGAKSLAVVTYPDRTRLEIGPDTVLQELAERLGKRVLVAKGSVSADVKKQPPDRPMVLASPHGEATVLGTTLRLAVDPGDKGSTRLEVTEGKVRLKRFGDGKGVDVQGGQFAVAAAGVDLTAKPLRLVAGLQALYLFREGSGTLVRDVSGVGAPLDLQIRKATAVSWRPAGLTVQAHTFIASPGPAAKIIEACKKSREITVEAWITPAKASPNFEGCLVSLSTDSNDRNVTLIQGDREKSTSLYAAYLRTDSTGAWGVPALLTPKGSTTARLTHLAYVRHAAGAEHLYVDGVEIASGTRRGDFSTWSDQFRLSLADEGPGTAEERPWFGEYGLVALYSRALTSDEVSRHFKSGVP